MTPLASGILSAACALVGTLAGTVLGFLLYRWTQSSDAKRKLKKELLYHQMRIAHCALPNELPMRLHALREFFDRHFELQARFEVNKKFYVNWLLHTFVEQGKPVIPPWGQNELKRLHWDVLNLEV